MSERYVLEIYVPDSFDDVWVQFESDTPFLCIHAGELINPGTWEGSKSPMEILEVLQVEHILWDGEAGIPKHKTCVYTTAVKGTAEARLHPT